MDEDNTLDIQQNVGDVGGDFTKTIVIGDEVDFSEDGAGAEMGDVEAVIDLTYNIFQYIPELVFVSIYGLIMYSAVLLITRIIKR
jgi:hypothetical protein